MRTPRRSLSLALMLVASMTVTACSLAPQYSSASSTGAPPDAGSAVSAAHAGRYHRGSSRAPKTGQTISTPVTADPTTTPTTSPPTSTTSPGSTSTTVAQTAPPSSAAGPYLFDDEFNGSSLDLTNWRPNWLAGSDTAITKPVNSEEASCYDPAQVNVSGGYLHLNAVARNCVANNGVTYQYASGLVESNQHFTFTYGHVEARVWLPGGATTDNWPAFWLDGTGSWPSTGELDVMEGLDGTDCWHFHSPSGGPGACANLPTPSGWHIFAADWRPGQVTYTYDGQQVGTITTGITGAPMYLIFNLGLKASSAVVPSQMLVDYVRVSA